MDSPPSVETPLGQFRDSRNWASGVPTTAMSFLHLTKGDNVCDFLLAFLDKAAFPNAVYSYRN